MTAYEKLEVPLSSGSPAMLDMSFELNGAAVTRAHDGDGWRITHIESGFAVPGRFKSAVAAEYALKEIDEIVDWHDFSRTIAKECTPNAAPLIHEILDRYGIVRDPNPVSAKETARLRERLGIGDSDTSVDCNQENEDVRN